MRPWFFGALCGMLLVAVGPAKAGEPIEFHRFGAPRVLEEMVVMFDETPILVKVIGIHGEKCVLAREREAPSSHQGN